MEYIKFEYRFYDEDTHTNYENKVEKSNEMIRADEICEMFMEFMRAAGYSEENVVRYFK